MEKNRVLKKVIHNCGRYATYPSHAPVRRVWASLWCQLRDWTFSSNDFLCWATLPSWRSHKITVWSTEPLANTCLKKRENSFWVLRYSFLSPVRECQGSITVVPRSTLQVHLGKGLQRKISTQPFIMAFITTDNYTIVTYNHVTHTDNTHHQMQSMHFCHYCLIAISKNLPRLSN